MPPHPTTPFPIMDNSSDLNNTDPTQASTTGAGFIGGYIIAALLLLIWLCCICCKAIDTVLYNWPWLCSYVYYRYLFNTAVEHCCGKPTQNPE